MYPTTLKPLLSKPGFAPGDITLAAAQCQEWFRKTAALEAPFSMHFLPIRRLHFAISHWLTIARCESQFAGEGFRQHGRE